jgi:hypothetical protein
MQNRGQSNSSDASQTAIREQMKKRVEKKTMWDVKSKLQRVTLLTLPVLLFAGVSSAQYPLLDKAANKVIQKYQNSSCEQLWQERGQPKSQREQEAVNFLRSDPQMRQMFIDRVAAPIANKMFECGMIP